MGGGPWKKNSPLKNVLGWKKFGKTLVNSTHFLFEASDKITVC